MARLLTSLLLLGLVVSGVLAQAFGRFGYSGSLNAPGLLVDRAGFCAKAPGATRFDFSQESKVWQPTTTTDVDQTIDLTNREKCPTKVNCSLYDPGVRFYFNAGFAFKLSSAKSPFLSWAEGSVGDGVPSPNLKWAIVSFQDDQPPVVLIFESNPGPSLSIQGKAGDWTIAPDKPYVGWIKVCLPIGTKPFRTDSASTLGVLTQRFTREQDFWLAPPAHLLDRKIESDALSVTCTWKFDRSGVIVPSPGTFAQLGGYPLGLPSRTRAIQATDENGPMLVTDQEELVMRFPVRRVPTGRFLAEGKALSSPPATVSPLDAPSVIDLGMENLTGTCDDATRKLAEDTLASYLDQANYFTEPATGQQLPFDANGRGIDLAAAHSFLMQALTTTRQATSEANSLLTSILWRTDWLTWGIWVDDLTVERRAAALASLAGSLCPEPERRLQAAMLEAGLAAQRGLNIYRRRVGLIPTEPPLLEAMEGLREVLFAVQGKVTGPECEFARAMLSEIRVFGSTAVYVDRKEGAMSMIWDPGSETASSFTLASAFPLYLERGGNLSAFTVKDALGFTRVQYKTLAPGFCNARFTLPAFAKSPPLAVDVPQYSETSR